MFAFNSLYLQPTLALSTNWVTCILHTCSDALSQIGRHRTFLSHSSCIWDVVSLPDPFLSTNVDNMLGGEAFATCSADGTIRLWHLDLGQEDTSKAPPTYSSIDNAHQQNVYSKDILGVLYIGLTPPLLGSLKTRTELLPIFVPANKFHSL
jgi:WD40 repeat protein